ncbi:phosphatidylinositol phospholipase C, gamma-1 [Fusarium oxysporum f. sp. pisi HDV247]|uniref:Phosphatidylinositol phospholipase C, gamma-1 n=1 Tax=Fusarium oxysporum f. sp. pisi HDV247 TaxID=1080344 RepID=W9NA36_FUSOX|nr:phosphatidylinositol phospholipase C, gamma-1 [Fusarium oxysporum f. sp. pisi HDV247]
MVNIMKEAFGSRLVTETLENCYDKLPSPSELMERILIVKKPQTKQEPPASNFRGRRRGNSLNSLLTRSMTDAAMLMPSQSLPQSLMQLGGLGVYCSGVNYAGFGTAEAKQYNHIFSFMESSFAKHFRTKEQKIAVNLHNQRYMM